MKLATVFALFAFLGCTNGAVPANQEAVATATQSIEDVTWVLESLNGEAISTPQGRKPVTLRLNSQSKQADVFGGINNFSGSYELKGDRIAFGLFMGTLIGGPPEETRIEDAMRKLVSGETRYEVSGERLTLTKGDGTSARFRSSTSS